MQSLECTHDWLMSKVDILYVSLNMGDKFPKLWDINLNFVWTLLLACDLKINIWKHAIGSFFKWDKLDQAIGGAQKALSKISFRVINFILTPPGTKLHQQTHKAIAKCQPALMSAIWKFNMYCEQLEALYDPSWSIPLPTPLPTKLNELQNHQSLMEDVWIAPSIGHIPCWMEDEDVCSGIWMMLKCDCCLEEQRWLSMEADNICCWFGNELAMVELALRTWGSTFLNKYVIATNLLLRQGFLPYLAAFLGATTDAPSMLVELIGIKGMIQCVHWGHHKVGN